MSKFRQNQLKDLASEISTKLHSNDIDEARFHLPVSKKTQQRKERQQMKQVKKKQIKKDTKKAEKLERKRQLVETDPIPAKKIKMEPKPAKIKPKPKRTVPTEESDIEDDLDHNSKDSGAIIITPDFLKRLNPPDEDLKIIKELERRLGIKKKRAKQNEKTDKNQLKKFLEEKRAKRQEEELEEIDLEEEEEEIDEIAPESSTLLDGLDELEAIASGKYDRDYDDEYIELAKQDGIDLTNEYQNLYEPEEEVVEEQDSEQEEGEKEMVFEDDEEEFEESEQFPKAIPKMIESDVNSTEYKALTKQIRSLLNKLTSANLTKIVTDLISLYGQSGKHDFHQILTTLVLNFVSENVGLSSDFLLDYASLMAIMNGSCGSEVGTYFLEKLINIFFNEFSTKKNASLNRSHLFAYLYDFDMIHVKLIYDVIVKLISSGTDLDIECLTRVLKVCGFKLRSEDPVLLKNILQLSNEKLEEGTSTKRTFLLDMLQEIKNNKRRNEDTEQYKNHVKAISQFVKSKNAIQVPLQDFLDVEKKGRWWIVGGAWKGVEKKSQEESDSSEVMNVASNTKLEKLAKEYKISTITKKTIFYILMGSEDATDAFAKLAKFGILKNDKEIFGMMIFCCLMEKVYNPYYANLAKQVCLTDKTLPRSLMFVLVEQMKQVGTWAIQKLVHLSKFMAQMIVPCIVPVTILKFVDIAHLEGDQVLFYRLLILHILDDEHFGACWVKLTNSEQLDLLKESIKLFLYYFKEKDSDFNDLLPILEPSKRKDVEWMKQKHEQITKRAKLVYKMISF